MKFKQLYLSILALSAGVTLVACGSGSSATPPSTTPVVTLMTESNMPTAVKTCFDGATSFASNVSAINNNGVMTGFIQANPESGCIQYDYLFGNSGNQVQIIPLTQQQLPDGIVATGARDAAISTNLTTVGITFASDGTSNPYEFATYNNYLTPNLITEANYLLGISENGTFIAGFNLGGQPTLFNTVIGSSYNLTFNNASMVGTILNGVSNIGLTVGSMQQTIDDTQQNTSGIVCSAQTKTCSYIVGGPTVGYDAYITTISGNSQWIYGFANLNGETQLFTVNPETYAVTALESGFEEVTNPITTGSVATESGLVVVKSTDSDEAYLLVPQNTTGSINSIYSVNKLVENLGLPTNVLTNSVYISPNGNYIAFDVSDYGSANLFGVKVYFPNGIANYVATNLKPINTSSNILASKPYSWFKGNNIK